MIKNATLGHDALTSGGVSGAPVIDLKTGLVVGLHSGGKWDQVRKMNFAVPLWKILRDQEFRDLLEESGATIPPPPATEDKTALLADLSSMAGYSETFIPGGAIPLPQTRNPDRTGEVLKGRVLKYHNYSVVMDERRGLPWFTASNVDRSRLQRVRRGSEKWQLDPRIPAGLQRGDDLYRQNDWDRGHLARPAAIAWGTMAQATEAYRSAFFFTNITPQHQNFNQKRWAALEEHVLRELHPESNRLCIFNGPIHAPSDVEYRGGRIPREFFMIAVSENKAVPFQPQVDAWLLSQYELTQAGVLIPLPKAAPDLKTTRASIEDIERKSELDFGMLKEWNSIKNNLASRPVALGTTH